MVTSPGELPPPHASARRVRRGGALLAAGFVLVAINLRLAIAAVSPVLVQIEASEHLSSAAAGLLTTIPLVCFGAFAFVAPRLLRSLAPEPLLASAVAVLIVGIVLRVVPGSAALYGGTVLIGGAIAIGNVLLPGVIKEDFPHRVALLTGLYSMSLSAGAAISAGLTVPVEHALHSGWRLAVGSWAIPAGAALVLWFVAAAGRASAPARLQHRGGPRVGGLWRDRLAWAVTAFMGLQSLGFYATLAWIPTIFEQHHVSAARAGWLLSFSSLPAIAAALLTPALARRLRHRSLPVVASLACCGVAYVGLALAPLAAPYGWMALLGLGQGSALSLALGYIVLRAPDPAHAGQLSIMAQGCGYLLACSGPLILGFAHQLSGSWQLPMLLLCVLLVPQFLSGLSAAQDRHVQSVGAPGEGT